ncbi:MAG: PSD1 and planctomycete cytochrome C domain-containing protein [Planctomycetia bacterium]|nr:PSD1 and planctomycete cytochrome C domain-containing protein [Planctomycetia bacterium]
MRRLLLISFIVVSAASGSKLLAADDAAKFVEDVLPLLEAKCVSCHGPEKQEGNLRLDSWAAAKGGGDRGAAIVPGDVEKSLLMQAVSFRDPDFQMPPKQKLSDKEIATLTSWVQSGAAWPEPVTVLFEDQPQFLAALANGNGKSRLLAKGAFGGQAALGITPLQRDGVKIPGWNFAIRQQPQPGEYRYLRLAWKKRGEGSVMIELAANGAWPDAKVAKGRYVAGPNTTGWAAISVSETAPSEWSVATFDLWKDIGSFTLTGIAPTCDRGEEAFFDSIILGPTIASLDAYRPGAGTANDATDSTAFGDALTDKRNPIRKLFRGERLDLWSLKKPSSHARQSVGDPQSGRPREVAPRSGERGYGSHTIDDFIRERLAKDNLQLAPEADRRTLIRRLTFDLIGLPPTPDEVAAFVADQAPDAYHKLVNRLLDSPRYGERQARLWLDVVRYADTNGYERDEFRPLAWQYRDYVIRSFNQDKPFDQFIVEQLAGDELVNGVPQNSAEADMLIATGFLRLGQWDSTATIFQEEPRLRAEMLADLTNTTASAFLGLTMSCCQCHDHKYDPLSQADHFRFRAFFAGVTSRDDLPVSVAEEQAEIGKHNAELDQQAAPLKAEQAKLDKANKQRHEELKAKLAEIEAKKRQPRRAMGVTESASPAATHIFYQGDFSSPREEVQPGIPTVLGTLDRRGSLHEPTRFNSSNGQSEVGRLIAERSTTIDSRRLKLANWIASAHNPWTARVIVNRVWQQHFGTGLVATPNDFGYSGARPTHPELLDWLAVEFMQRGWSIKELHRLIVKSATYRRTALQGRPAGPGDPTYNTQNVRRLDAEMLRDSLLAVSGLLKPHDTGKPLWPSVPDELLNAQPAILEAIEGKDGGRMQGWYSDPIEQTDVRSVFLVRKRCLPIPFLQAFDLPDTTVSCARRDTTVVAPQALMLLNSPEVVRFAQAFAERLRGPQPNVRFDDAAQIGKLIDTIFQQALQRSASTDEVTLATEFLRRHRDQHAAKEPTDRAATLSLIDLCRAVLNLNEFAYVD